MNNGFTFGGIKKPYITVREKKRPITAPIRRNLITIPGYKGALLDSTEVEVLILSVLLLIEGNNQDEYKRNCEDFAAWIVKEKATELIFEDDPDRTYYALVQGSFDPNEIVRIGEVQVNFLCVDPHKYGPEKLVNFTNTASFIVEGSAEPEPIVTCKIKQDTTFVAVSNGKELNMIGNITEAEQAPFERETRVLWDQMGSLVGWTTSINTEESASAGTMQTNGYEFLSADYGNGAAWHGPAVKKSIGQTLQDFKVETIIQQKGASGQLGGVEIALLDANNQFVTKLQMFKRSAGSNANTARLRAGKYDNGQDIINEYGDHWSVWQNFRGMLRIERVGNVWTAYVAALDDIGQHSAQRYRTWTDTNNIAIAPVTQVQVQLLQYGTSPATVQKIEDVKVFKINQQQGIPFVAKVGDIIEFNHKEDIIRKNGEDITNKKAFIGEYFLLNSGENTIVAEPADAIESVEVRWRDRWR